MLGTTEIFLILIVVLILFIAPRRISELARSVGEGIRAFRQETREIGVEASEQPLLVFVSSVIDELNDERQAIHKAIERIPLAKPWLFEYTPASSQEVNESYLSKIKESDIFVLVIGSSISMAVMREFESARANNKPCLVFLKDCERIEEAQTFVGNIQAKWSKFSTSEELAHLVQLALVDELIRGYREGSQEKLSDEHLSILVSIKEVLTLRETDQKSKEKKDIPADITETLRVRTPVILPVNPRIDGDNLYAKGDFQNAAKAYTRMIFLSPDDPDGFYQRHYCYYDWGKFEFALADLKRAISLSPKSAYYYTSLAVVYYALKKYEAAIAACDHAIALDDKIALAYDVRGTSKKRLNKGAVNGEDDLRTAIKLSIAEKKYNCLGDSYYCLGEYQNALNAFQASLDKALSKPDKAYAYWMLGLCYKATGRRSEAEKHFRECISLGESHWANEARKELKEM